MTEPGASPRSRLARLAGWAVVCGCCVVLAACSDDEGDDDDGIIGPPGSTELPTQEALHAALVTAVGDPPAGNGGLSLNMWATVVDRSGIVRAITFTGDLTGDQWPGSRVISAQKANTANSFSLTGLALSTANLFTATQPGGSLFGLQESNPVNTEAAYGGDANDYGTADDFMIGKRIGGVNVFGGGLALYDASGEIIGAVGVSGDTSCADHNIGWKLRDALGLDFVPFGVSATEDDNIIYDIGGDGVSESGFGHPECSAEATSIGVGLPTSHPIGD
jgi:uncharacterized protein GlcG (DUF336 family)